MAKKAPAGRVKRLPAPRARKSPARATKGRARTKPTASAPRKAATAAAPAKTFGARSVTFALDVRPDGLEPLLGAAYMMTDRCYVSLGGDRRRTLEVTLEGRQGAEGAALKELAELFERELATQRVRWAIARKNLPVREYIAEQAVRQAQGGAAPQAGQPQPQQEELSAEQRKEIDALIAEVEAEIQSLKGSDPENLSAPWETKHRPG